MLGASHGSWVISFVPRAVGNVYKNVRRNISVDFLEVRLCPHLQCTGTTDFDSIWH